MNLKSLLIQGLLVAFISTSFSCASRIVISDDIRNEAVGDVPFPTIAKQTDRFLGKTVILGGNIVETKNVAGEARMVVLQTPLSMGEKPAGPSRSQGGFVLTYRGYLEPEVYEQGRKVTVAGRLAGRVTEQTGDCRQPCLKLIYRQIYLWPRYEATTYHPDFFDEDAYDPYDSRY